MTLTAEEDSPAGGAMAQRQWALKSILSGLADDMREYRQRSVDLRLMQELPEHLLKDMGISRSEIGSSAIPAPGQVLKRAGDWR